MTANNDAPQQQQSSNNNNDDDNSSSSKENALSLALLQARRTLWLHPPRFLPWFLSPFREFFLDPTYKICGILLPLFFRQGLINNFMAKSILVINLPILRFFYHRRPASHRLDDISVLPPPPQKKKNSDGDNSSVTTSPKRQRDGGSSRRDGGASKSASMVRAQSRASIMVDPTAPGSNRVIMIDPPTKIESAFLGVLAFVVSVIGDILGAITNPQKYKGWMDACTQLESYLVNTGLADELHQSIVTPLIQGRLLVNVKMLSDIQSDHLSATTHPVQAAQFNTKGIRSTEPSSNSSGNNTGGNSAEEEEEHHQQSDTLLQLRDEIKWGHKWMRFATAAYGIEMIRSALDRDVQHASSDSHSTGTTESSEQQSSASLGILNQLNSAIAFHCEIEESDILLTYKDDNTTDSILHHFVAIDHASKSIVLALRGTLSLSEAIVDVKGMTREFCGSGVGQAHVGIADMAEKVWEKSGNFIQKILSESKYEDYNFIITGHSLGAGTACLLNIKLHVEGLLGPNNNKRSSQCFAFAPPPTFFFSKKDTTIIEEEANEGEDEDEDNNNHQDSLNAAVDCAIENTTAYIQDNDVVPHLSVSSVRRLAGLFDAVDQQSVQMSFYRRWRVFYDYEPVPQEMVTAVVNKAAAGGGEESSTPPRAIDGACELTIPARVVVWCREKEEGKFEAYACDPNRVAQGHIILAQDMLTDHLPDMYEDALDALLDELSEQQ